MATSFYPSQLLSQYLKEQVATAYTVATLPAAADNAYVRAFVTDATAPTFGATVAGAGAVITPVWSDGTNWIVG